MAHSRLRNLVISRAPSLLRARLLSSFRLPIPFSETAAVKNGKFFKDTYWDIKKGEAVLCDEVNISIAVATDKGLMTPIVRNADKKSISAISSEIKELAERARAGKLKPNEFQAGTFSISSLGMFPVDHFCAIINPPQAGILAVGRGNQVVEPVVGADGIEKRGVVTKMNLKLSADHRVFDGHVGGAFVAALRSNFVDIRRLLL